MTVPYIFATQSGNISLGELDVNFANVKSSADTAATVTASAQPNITSVGTLSTLNVSGPVSASGNVTGIYILGDGSQLTNLPVQYSNVNVGYYLQTGITSNIITTGNVAGTYILGNGSQLTGLPSTYTNADVADYLSSGNVSTDILTTGSVSSSGNVTGAFIIGDGGFLSNVTVTSNVAVTQIQDGTTILRIDGAGGNVVMDISGAGNAAVFSGNELNLNGNITATGNVAGTYILGNGSQLTGLSSTYANTNVAAYLSSGTVSTNVITTGNISSGNSIVSNKTTTKILETVKVSLGTVSGPLTIDVSAGAVQSFTTSGNVTLSFTNWGPSDMNNKVTLLVTVANVAHKITGTLGIKNTFGVIGLNHITGTMSFPIADDYSFEFTSSDNGSTIFMSENNALLRPYNSSSEAITNTSNASISLGTTYSIYFPTPLSSSGTAYLTDGIAGQTKVLGSLGTSNWTVTVPSSSWAGNDINFSAAGQNITLVWSESLSVWLVLNSHGSVVLS